jgi:hypothetical protein
VSNLASSQRALLAGLVVSSLHRTFVHDNVDFMDKDKFDRLLKPLVAQLELALVDRTPTEFVEFMEMQLMPTLVQLALRLNSEVCGFQRHKLFSFFNKKSFVSSVTSHSFVFS